MIIVYHKCSKLVKYIYKYIYTYINYFDLGKHIASEFLFECKTGNRFCAHFRSSDSISVLTCFLCVASECCVLYFFNLFDKGLNLRH